MKKIIFLLIASFAIMSFSVKEEDSFITTTEYDFDTCSQRDCYDLPDGTNVCGPWYDVDCKDFPLPSPGPGNQ